MKDISTLTQSCKKTIGNDPKDIMINYCTAQKINIGDFLGLDNSLLRDKKICSYIISELCQIDLISIAKMLKLKDHSSISKYISFVKKEYNKEDNGFKIEYAKILARICAVIKK